MSGSLPRPGRLRFGALLTDRVDGPYARLARICQRLGFWLAVVVPVVYLPLLVGGFAGPREVAAFVGLLVLNGVALVVGHGYD